MPNLTTSLQRRPRIQVIWVVFTALLVSASAEAKPRTLGWLEWAYMEPGHLRLKAKLDTGARTSSIDAVDVEPFERDQKHWVRFRIPLSKRLEDTNLSKDIFLERPVVRETLIKDHLNESMTRYVVNIDVCLGGITFTTPVTLADRHRFNYPLLLGRIALQGRAVVDAAQKFTDERSCHKTAADHN